MKRIRVGLNGFGRIGRAFTRIALVRDTFDLVAINTRRKNPVMSAYLLQYDSVYRKYGKHVGSTEDSLVIDGKEIRFMEASDPSEIPWEEAEVDVVVDATGAFVKKSDLEKHIRGTVKKVILTAPSKDDETPHVVLGVNDHEFDFAGSTVISNASCTTNCSAPLFKVLHEHFKVWSGFLTTVHAYTASQVLVDENNKEPDRSRAAAQNIAPSSTGAAKAVVKVIPALTHRIDGMAVRVPVPTVSFTDISVITERPTTVEEVNRIFKEAADGPMKGILAYEKEMLVSSDFIGSPYSCIYDENYTKVIEGTLVKVFGWYDNEWGYSTRLVDLVERVSDFV
ncbi:MAG: type I glyceraldehyde-3-phosphate dehydrogenase [Patescibacteria group bacterium]|nr:type I glyceraldehyde-3-phosphate dehydrogenase [Patescibacteria group bacterium]